MVEFLIHKLVIGNKIEREMHCGFVRWRVFEDGIEGICVADDVLVNDWTNKASMLSVQ